MDYLLLRLYGPMASWGDIAVGESRHSHAVPTKSAVMGLLAAALGIPREQEDAHRELNERFSMACAILSEGDLLRDYHTVQAPDSVGKFRYRTRRDELILGRDRLGTVLSSRDYRTDACALVALSAAADTGYTLEQLLKALKTPRFTLYLGRKSCPLGAPLQPEIITADNYSQAFSLYTPAAIPSARSARHGQSLFDSKEWVDYYWEGSIESFGSIEHLDTRQLMQLTRHDRLLSRQRWQYGANRVYRYRSMEER